MKQQDEEEADPTEEEDQGEDGPASPVPGTLRRQTFVRTTWSSVHPTAYPPDPRVGRGPYLTSAPPALEKPPWVNPPVPPSQDIVLRSATLRRLQHVPTESDPRYRTALYDWSGNKFDLGNRRYRGDFGTRARYLTQRPPDIDSAFQPMQRSSEDVVAALSWQQLGVLNYEPRPVSEIEINSVNGWVQLPEPSPVWCNIPGLGASMCLYWRPDLLVPEVLRYAVVKLLPMGVDTADPFRGLLLDIFAEWCTPMKWAVSLFGNSAIKVVLVSDEGTEFEMDVRTFRWSRDVRVAVARNALIRDYPGFMRSFLAVKPEPVDPAVVEEAEQNARAFEDRRASALYPPAPAPAAASATASSSAASSNNVTLVNVVASRMLPGKDILVSSRLPLPVSPVRYVIK
jgi:hypothetical protein